MTEFDDALQIKAACYRDPGKFCRLLLSEWFEWEQPWFHLGILAILQGRCEFLLDYPEQVLDKILRHFYWRDDPTDPDSPRVYVFYWEDGCLHMRLRRYTALLIPRGFSKTTLCNASNVMDILYEDVKFGVYISEAAPHAMNQLASVKSALEGNDSILTLFGDVAPERNDTLKWTDTEIETKTGVYFVARGRGGQIRGLNRKSYRPDKIVIDDLEDEESVLTQEQREKTERLLYRSIMPALSRKRDSRIVMLGTMLSPEALLVKVAKDPRFAVINLQAIDEDGDPLWPRMVGEEELEATREAYAAMGRLPDFYLEYFNTVRGDAKAPFRPEMIHHRPPTMWKNLQKAIVCDPAISANRKADNAAIAVVGIDPETGEIWVLDIWMKKGPSPREIIDQYFAMAKGWRCDRHGVESIGYQAALVHLLTEEMARKHYFFECHAITHSSQTHKDTRILGILQGRYAAGYVRHARRFLEYETQLLDFPLGKKDGPDAVAMAISLLDDFAMLALPPEVNPMAEEMPKLEAEMAGDYRGAWCP